MNDPEKKPEGKWPDFYIPVPIDEPDYTELGERIAAELLPRVQERMREQQKQRVQQEKEQPTAGEDTTSDSD